MSSSTRAAILRATHQEVNVVMAGEVILIIEDDVHIGGLVTQVLREAGFAPEQVRDVGLARAWAEGGRAPAAVLSDLMVPGSAGPDKLPAELAALFPGVPIALMTGVPPRRRAALGVTHEPIVEKPFEIEMLLDTITTMLAARDR
jgi:DNA-binding NtrC family response regulator